jgi:hypothetical protein
VLLRFNVDVAELDRAFTLDPELVDLVLAGARRVFVKLRTPIGKGPILLGPPLIFLGDDPLEVIAGWRRHPPEITQCLRREPNLADFTVGNGDENRDPLTELPSIVERNRDGGLAELSPASVHRDHVPLHSQQNTTGGAQCLDDQSQGPASELRCASHAHTSVTVPWNRPVRRRRTEQSQPPLTRQHKSDTIQQTA